jgi:hypothetical protein
VAWDTVLTSEGDLDADMASWESSVSPTSVDKITMTRLGRNRLAVLIQYTA